LSVACATNPKAGLDSRTSGPEGTSDTSDKEKRRRTRAKTAKKEEKKKKVIGAGIEPVNETARPRVMQRFAPPSP